MNKVKSNWCSVTKCCIFHLSSKDLMHQFLDQVHTFFFGRGGLRFLWNLSRIVFLFSLFCIVRNLGCPVVRLDYRLFNYKIKRTRRRTEPLVSFFYATK